MLSDFVHKKSDLEEENEPAAECRTRRKPSKSRQSGQDRPSIDSKNQSFGTAVSSLGTLKFSTPPPMGWQIGAWIMRACARPLGYRISEFGPGLRRARLLEPRAEKLSEAAGRQPRVRAVAPLAGQRGLRGCAPRVLCLFAWLGLALGPAQPASARDTPEIIAEVSAPSYLGYLSSLPVYAGDSRGYDYETGLPEPDLLSARVTIFDSLVSILGPQNVYYQEVQAGGFSGQNIVGVFPGVDPAHYGTYLVGAHYDAIREPGYNTSGSPGADDNASGVAGVLEAARVLALGNFKANIYFVAFDLEETRTSPQLNSMRGSYTFAQNALATGLDLRGMVNLDMIGFHWAPEARSVSVTDALAGGVGGAVADALERQGMTVNRIGALDWSDHYRFKQAGFDAAWVTASDLLDNPYVHSTQDYLDNTVYGSAYLDAEYAAAVVRSVVDYLGTAAVHAPEPAATAAIMAFLLIGWVLRRRWAGALASDRLA